MFPFSLQCLSIKSVSKKDYVSSNMKNYLTLKASSFVTFAYFVGIKFSARDTQFKVLCDEITHPKAGESFRRKNLDQMFATSLNHRKNQMQNNENAYLFSVYY